MESIGAFARATVGTAFSVITSRDPRAAKAPT